MMREGRYRAVGRAIGMHACCFCVVWFWLRMTRLMAFRLVESIFPTLSELVLPIVTPSWLKTDRIFLCRYFGRARQLPGVKELFEVASKPHKEPTGPTQAELRRNVDAAYYGYNLDEEDGTLLAYEAQKEREAMENLLKEADDQNDGKGDKWEELPGDSGDGVVWRLPTLEEVQEELVERRRRKLLDKLG